MALCTFGRGLASVRRCMIMRLKSLQTRYNLTLNFHWIGIHFFKLCTLELFILNSVILLTLATLW